MLVRPTIRYDQEDDVLLVWFSQKLASKAQMSGPVVLHLSDEGEPVLLEILSASAFVEDLNERIMTAKAMPEGAP